MSEFVVSTRYANALMESSEEKKSFEKVLADVRFVKNTLSDSKELRNFLSNPTIASTKKSDALMEIFKENTGKDMLDFLKFLVAKGRENILNDICDRFIDLSNEKLNQAEVIISSAVELNETQKNELKVKLEKILNKKIIPSFMIDSEIIGGFKARVEDTVIDASIKHQLSVLKKKLFEESYLKN